MKTCHRLLAASLLLLCLPCGPAWAESEWETISEDDDGVKVQKKEVKDSDLVAFRGETVINAPLRKVLWVLMDNTRRTEWVDRLEKSTILKKFSNHEYVIYQHFGLPFFMSDRDYVYRGRAVRDAAGVVTLHMSSCEWKDSPETVGVRANLIGSKYTLTPKAKGKKTKLEVEIHTDPCGMIPSWLVNVIQKSWPAKTLNGVREQVQKPYIKLYPLPPVTPAKQDGAQPAEEPAKEKAAAKQP